MSHPGLIPARRGAAAFVKAGERIRVINTHGSQVVDTWAFVRHDMREHMSMEHTRATLEKICPAVGDHLYTNRRRPIVTLVGDDSPGRHDTLMAACDNPRYGLLGCTHFHDNCQDNLHAALQSLGLAVDETPSPFNIFMHIPWQLDGTLSWEAPVSKPGDVVTLEAQLDLVIAFSACPQDLLPINGAMRTPTEAHYAIDGTH